MTLIVFLIGVTAVSATDTTQQTVADDNTEIQEQTAATIASDNTVKASAKESNKNIKKDDVKTNETITILNSTYNKYFNNLNGEMLSKIPENSTVLLQGNFSDKVFGISKKNIYFTSTKDAILNNVKVSVSENGNGATITGLTIKNTPTFKHDAAIENNAVNVTITKNNIEFEKNENKAYGIYSNGAINLTVTDNNVKVRGPSVSIDWSGSVDDAGIAKTSGISAVFSYNAVIKNNYVNTTKAKKGTDDAFGTIDSLEIRGENFTVTNNTVIAGGARFCYAINGLNLKNANITDNKVISESERYADGLQFGNGVSNIYVANNDITCTAHNTTIFTGDNEPLTYGIITTSMGGSGSGSIIIEKNKINLNSTIGYGMEIYSTNNTNITGNEITTDGVFSSGIVFAHSANSTLENNTIKTSGDSNITINHIDEEIRPRNVGINIQQKSDNILIENNRIKSTDKAGKANTIFLNTPTNVTIKNNLLDTDTLQGDASIGNNGTQTNVTKENNTSGETGLKTANITINFSENPTVGSTVKITANVIDSKTGEKLNNGVIVFKINRKTIYVNGTQKIKVQNGVASIDYSLKDMTAKNYEITAKFGNNNEYDTAETSKTLSVQKTNIAVENNTTEVYSGGNITINTVLKDQNGNVLKGENKVNIKLNGKTIMNTKISNGVLNINITIPAGTKAGVQNLKITIGESSRYNTAVINYTVNVLKQDPVFKYQEVSTYPGQYAEFKINITTQKTNDPAKSGKVGLKLNGKTMKNMAKDSTVLGTTVQVKDGQAVFGFYLPFDIKTGKHNITVTFSGNGCMEGGRTTDAKLTVLA